MTGLTGIGGNITTNTTWSGRVYVTSSVYVRDDATLTIEPGTQILVKTGARIVVSTNSTGSTLSAVGTEAAPISFCGVTATPGAWGGILVDGGLAVGSALEHVLIEDGGGVEAGLVLRAPLRVNDLQVRNSGTDGV
ncbi:MAG: hypothetical protein FJ104_14280 [Deltaproteobacteria bacterium]|nr:hypothetical protein [Deltaproteobacteria bacterium]